MKRLASIMLLLIAVGILGACGSSNKLDEKAQKAEESFLSYENELNKEDRKEGNASSFQGDLTHDDVQKIYYSGEDFSEYLFITNEQLYQDSDLKEKDRIFTGHYISKNDDTNIISEKEFEKLLKDDSNNFELIYEAK
ncbi:hypothetical protein ACFC3Z_13420 [Enterococcus thailandicus]|uniref:hypothetical protein n=1 Tax=Enterococcus thailandicus TaxID=417368 RepID=UPI0035DD8AAC